ncbi:MAG TPA: hypothetical protein GX701_09115 [Clostridiales bacterium]|nr:hypothetical protein [Clostridiales bacterium]
MRDWLKKHDVLNKLLAVVLSIVLWFIIMDRINPDVTIPFHDVKVTIKGETELLTTKKYSIISNTDQTVDVTLRGKRSALMGLRKSDLEIIADVSQITEDGESQILCTVNTPDESITVVDRNRLRISVVADVIDEIQIPLRPALLGTPAEGYRLGDHNIASDETITVRGARTEVSRIAYARVSANIANRTESLEITAPIEFIDHSGKVMELRYTQSEIDSFTLSVEINAVRELPLHVTIVPGGGLTAEQVEYTILPGSITVMGPKSLLDNIEYINLGTVDLDGIGEDNTLRTEKTVDVLGLKSLSEQTTATVTVTVKNIEVHTIGVRDVRFVGELPNGLVAKMQDEAIAVRLRGNRDLLRAMKESDLEVTVNLSEISVTKPGTVVTVPAVVTVRGGLKAEVLGDYTVDLDITAP